MWLRMKDEFCRAEGFYTEIGLGGFKLKSDFSVKTILNKRKSENVIFSQILSLECCATLCYHSPRPT